MTATRNQVIAAALPHLGEYWPGVSPYGDWYGNKVGDPHTYDRAAFCAMGLSFVFDSVGALDIFPLHAYTPAGVNWFKARGQWHNGRHGIQAGDIAYWDFPGLPNRVSHVSLIESPNGDGSVNGIDFNTSGTAAGDQRNGRAVLRKRRRDYLVGYGRPAYADAPAPTAPSVPRNADGSLTIDVDGIRGAQTVGRWQEVLGTPIDFVISTPSTMIAADQAMLNRVVAAEHIRNLDPNQRRRRGSLATDGLEGAHTIAVRQFWLRNAVNPVHQQNLIGHLLDFDGILGRETNLVHQYALNRATTRSGIYGPAS